MKFFASTLTIIMLLLMYMSFNVATAVTWIGVASLVLYLALETMSTLSSDVDYSWKTDKTVSILYASSFSVFSMSSAIFFINSL